MSTLTTLVLLLVWYGETYPLCCRLWLMDFLRSTLTPSERDRFGIEPAVEVVPFLPGGWTTGMDEIVTIFTFFKPSTRSGTKGVVSFDDGPEVLLAGDPLKNITAFGDYNFSFIFHKVSFEWNTTSEKTPQKLRI